MGYLVDTNVISEVCKKAPNDAVISWLSAHSDNLHLSVVTIEEMRFGQLMMPKGKRRTALGNIIDSLVAQFSSKILLFDIGAADICAELHEKAISAGRNPTFEDLMIAAIAKQAGHEVVTRNVKDFDYLDIAIVNPFEQ